MSVYCIKISGCSSVCWDTSCVPCQSAPFGPIRGSGETKYKQFPAKVLRTQQHLITCQLRSRRYDLGQMSTIFVFMIFLLFWGWLHVILNAYIFDCILTVIYCSFGMSCIVYWQQLDIFQILSDTKKLFPNINVPHGLYCMIRIISITNCLESPIQKEVTNPKQLWLSAHFQPTCSVCLNW